MGIAKDLYRSVLLVLPEKPALYLIYFRGYQKILNLKNPQYFGEKIQWLKLYGHLDELSDYVDKYAVREFVAKTVGDKYLNQLYGVYNNPDEIDYKKFNDIKSLMYEVETALEEVYDADDLQALSIELSEFNYYHNTNK